MDEYLIIPFYPGSLPEEYKNFIIATFLNSLRSGNEWFKLIDKHAYFETYNLMIEKMMLHKDAVTRLAVLKEDPDVALGWSIMRPNILDYVFTKKDVRRNGIGRTLTNHPYKIITNITKHSEIIRNKGETVFNPFI